MTLYKAKKGNIGFYIQSNEIEDYFNLGYQIVKVEEIYVDDIQNELKKIERNSNETK